MKNSEYWRLRFEQLEEAQNRKGAVTLAEIEKLYRETQKQIEGQIARWYQRFANNNEITLAEARQYLKTAELKEFKWDVYDYIKHGKEHALTGGWMKELENASVRFHISKLEALKIHIQQSLETLFSKQNETITEAMGDLFKSGYYHTAYEIQKGFNIGWDIAGLNQSQIRKVLAKPWAVDGKNFSERIWGNKEKLISEIHSELTQNIMLGADPQKAIDSLAKKMNTSKYNAGRLIMTEEAYFSSVAQKECFEEFGVEQYEVVATLDFRTSDICRSFDGKHFSKEDYNPGVTAPPFHVRCRSTTAPYFDDDFGYIGKRVARDLDGSTYYVPANITYEQWKQMQDAKYGAGSVDKARKMEYNKSADKKQFNSYKKRLGDDAPKTFEEFQKLKYNSQDGYTSLKTAYADKGIQHRIQNNPEYTTLKTGQQGKHIIGHNNYTEGRSYLTVSMDEAQELVKKYAGTGALKRDGTGSWTHKEFVTADKIIGYTVDLKTGKSTATRRFSISYATGKNKGAHIVPAEED